MMKGTNIADANEVHVRHRVDLPADALEDEPAEGALGALGHESDLIGARAGPREVALWMESACYNEGALGAEFFEGAWCGSRGTRGH